MSAYRRMMLPPLVLLGGFVCPVARSAPMAPAVTAESAIVMDAGSGKVLWSRNPDEELYPASTTKIMTALLLMERCKPDDVIVAPADVEKVRESTMHLKPGEHVKVRDMLYALMLRSANDGCYAVACHISGSVPKFADLMNQRARELGCTHTNFDNPNGLNDPLHYTSAHDLALIAREAMQHEEFRDIVRTERITINRSIDWKDIVMTNHNKILFRDPTCDGIKTGWTIPAGHCFVGSAIRDDWRVITVVMKSRHWEKETEDLFNWAYADYRRVDEATAGQVLGRAKVKGGESVDVSAIAAESAYALIPRLGDRTAATRLDLADLQAPVAKSSAVGTYFIQDPDGYSHSVKLLAGEAVPQSKAALVKRDSSDSRIWLAAGLVVGAIIVRGRTKRRVMRAVR